MALAGVLFLQGCVVLASDASVDPVEALLRDFEAVALSVEDASFRETVVKRWCRPVAVYLPPDLPDDMARVARVEIDWLSKVDGLDVTSTQNRSAADIVVRAPADREEFERIVDELFPDNRWTRRRLKKANCFFEFTTDSNSCIARATVVAPSYRSPEQRANCMAEELVQAMGLPNDAATGPESVFDERSMASTASKRDRWIARILYDRSLQPGMTKDQALSAARPVVETILSGERGG